MIDSKVNQTKETLCLEGDMVMAILRHFSWNLERTQQEWFDNQSQIAYQTGIEFDETTFKKLSK